MLHPWAIEEMKSDKRDDEGNSVRFGFRFLDQRFMKQYVFAYKAYLFLELFSSDFLKLVDEFISSVTCLRFKIPASSSRLQNVKTLRQSRLPIFSKKFIEQYVEIF